MLSCKIWKINDGIDKNLIMLTLSELWPTGVLRRARRGNVKNIITG